MQKGISTMTPQIIQSTVQRAARSIAKLVFIISEGIMKTKKSIKQTIASEE